MFNFLSSCGFCSNIPGPGTYALETFRKVPVVGGIFGNLSSLANLGNLANMAGGLGGLGGLGNLGGIAQGLGGLGSIGGMFGQNQGGLAGNIGNMMNNSGSGGQGGFDFSKFVNNVPMDSIKANDSNFSDLIQDKPGVVVKKVLKSNYAQLIK